MKLLYCAIFPDIVNEETLSIVEYSIFSNSILASALNNHTIRLFQFISRSVLQKLCEKAQNDSMRIQDGEYIIYCSRNKSHRSVIITDNVYPSNVAQRLLYKISTTNVDTMNIEVAQTDLKTIFIAYSNPNVDSLYKIKCELEDTKKVLHSNIEKLFERGDKLDDLIERSDRLSTVTKTFYKKAKKTNRWCPFWFVS